MASVAAGKPTEQAPGMSDSVSKQPTCELIAPDNNAVPEPEPEPSSSSPPLPSQPGQDLTQAIEVDVSRTGMVTTQMGP